MKKGQAEAGLAGAIGVVTLLIALALALGIGNTVLSDLEDEQDDQIATHRNFTRLIANNTLTTLFHTEGVTCTAVVASYNGTTGQPNRLMSLPTNFYTCTNSGFRALLTGNATNKSLGYNITYTHVARSYTKNATISGQEGVNSVAQFQDTIALVVVASLIIGLVLGLVALVSRRQG